MLREEEKKEIRSMSLPVLLAKEITAVDMSDEESPEDESDGDTGPHPHRQIVWRVYEISVRRHCRVACATDTSRRW